MGVNMDQDEQMERRIDAVVEDDVRRGYRVKEVPDNLLRSLREALDGEPTVPQFTHVRFNKITPKKKRMINEAVIRRYHADVQNMALLSSARLRELNIERGEWSVEQEKRMQWLERETNRMMRDLYADGFSARETWATSLIDASAELRGMYEKGLNEDGEELLNEEQRTDLVATFDRWLEWTPATQDLMNVKFGELFDGVYKVDTDYGRLIEMYPLEEAVTLLGTIDDLRDRLNRYVECVNYREELLKLQIKQGKMLSESVEQRRDMTEEMARLYYCAEICNEAGVGLTPLTPAFDALWDLPEDVVNWLLVEIFFFFEGTPDVEGARDFLAQWGFIAAPEQTSKNGAKESSDESPEALSSSTDSPPADKTPADSSASMTPTI